MQRVDGDKNARRQEEQENPIRHRFLGQSIVIHPQKNEQEDEVFAIFVKRISVCGPKEYLAADDVCGHIQHFVVLVLVSDDEIGAKNDDEHRVKFGGKREKEHQQANGYMAYDQFYIVAVLHRVNKKSDTNINENEGKQSSREKFKLTINFLNAAIIKSDFFSREKPNKLPNFGI